MQGGAKTSSWFNVPDDQLMASSRMRVLPGDLAISLFFLPLLGSVSFLANFHTFLSLSNPAITLSAALPFIPFMLSPGGPPLLDCAESPEAINSILSCWLFALSSSFLFVRFCWLLPSSSLYAHSGRFKGFQSSCGKVLAYCFDSSTPADLINLGKRLGFFNAEDEASLALKWTPCFFNSKKWANFRSAPVGEPGGEGGISKFGLVSIVRFRIAVRCAVYGEEGAESLLSSSIVVCGRAVGPTKGDVVEGPL